MVDAPSGILFSDLSRALLRKGISLNSMVGDQWAAVRGLTQLGGDATIRRHAIDDICRAAPTSDDAARAVVLILDPVAAEVHWPTPEPAPLKVGREAKRDTALSRKLQTVAAKAAAAAPPAADESPPEATA